MDYRDYLVHYSPAEAPELYADWAWLVGKSALQQPLAMTSFGDLFFRGRWGRVMFLDTIEGVVTKFAKSPAQMEQLLHDPKHQERYLLSQLVTTMRSQGVVLSEGRIYFFKQPLLLGGEAVSANVETASMRVGISLTGQLHRQMGRRR